MSERPSIAILAGGGSRRMGRNKALLPLPPTGDTMIQSIAHRVGSLTDDLMIVGPTLPEYLALPARTIPDAGIRVGPLAGIATALTFARQPTCLVIACDLPLLQPALLQYLCQISARLDVDALVPKLTSPAAAASDHAWQPLLAVYHQRCLPSIADMLTNDERRVQQLFSTIRVRPVLEHDLRRFDPDLLSFINVNDEATYQRVREFLTGTASSSELWQAQSAGHSPHDSGKTRGEG